MEEKMHSIGIYEIQFLGVSTKLGQKTLKSDIEDLKKELNKVIESASELSLCEGYVLGLSTKLDRLIVQYMEIESDSNGSTEEDLYEQTM